MAPDEGLSRRTQLRDGLADRYPSPVSPLRGEPPSPKGGEGERSAPHAIGLDLSFKRIQRRERRLSIDTILSTRQPIQLLRIDRRRMVDDVAVVIEIVRHRPDRAEIVQTHIRKLRQP